MLLLNYLIEAKGGKVKEAGIPNSFSPKDQHLLDTKGPAPPGRKQTGTGTSGGSLAEVCCTFTFHGNWIIIVQLANITSEERSREQNKENYGPL